MAKGMVMYDGGGYISYLPLSITLFSDSWFGSSAPYMYDVNISGHTNTKDIVDLMIGESMTISQIAEAQNAHIVKVEWISNTVLRLYAYGEKPISDLPIKIIINKS